MERMKLFVAMILAMMFIILFVPAGVFAEKNSSEEPTLQMDTGADSQEVVVNESAKDAETSFFKEYWAWILLGVIIFIILLMCGGVNIALGFLGLIFEGIMD